MLSSILVPQPDRLKKHRYANARAHCPGYGKKIRIQPEILKIVRENQKPTVCQVTGWNLKDPSFLPQISESVNPLFLQHLPDPSFQPDRIINSQPEDNGKGLAREPEMACKTFSFEFHVIQRFHFFFQFITAVSGSKKCRRNGAGRGTGQIRKLVACLLHGTGRSHMTDSPHTAALKDTAA